MHFCDFVGDFTVPHPLPPSSVEVLSGVPKHKKVAMCLTDQICVFGKLGSGMNIV